MGTNTYYILFTCSENNNIKIESILTSLSNQIENYPFNSKNKNIRILACKDTIELPIKKELLLKEVHSPFYVFLDETDDVPDTYIEEMMLKWDNTVKNAVVTACNSKYFRSCLTLITSLFKHSNNDIDFIYVFDLGLTHSEQNVLSTIKKVIFIPMIEILMYTHTIRTIFPEFLTPNMFAWKPLFIRFVFEHSDIQNVFWLDSGIVTFGNIKFIFEHIKKYGCWLTEDGFVNHNFTHAVCKEIMQANDEEMEGTQLLAGLSGFNKDKGLDILHKWCHFCSIKGCVFGEHWLKEPIPIMSNGKQFIVHGHRHDQSILSILRIRYKLPTVLKTWDFYEFRSLDHAQKNNSLFYNHHGSYEDIQL